MEGSTRLASWAMALPRVLPKVDQPEMFGRVVGPLEVEDQPVVVDRHGDVDVEVLLPCGSLST